MLSYDHQLNINGTSSQYSLVRDDEGRAMYQVTEEIPEHQTTLKFSQKNWVDGHGQYTAGERDMYFEGQSVDTTQEGKIFLGPSITTVQESDASALDSTPVGFYWAETAGKWLCWTAGKIYSYGTAWTAATDTVVGVTDIAELNGILYASVPGTAYYFSTDGGTWSQNDLTDGTANGFIVSPNADGILDVLWKFKAPNELSNTTDGRTVALGGEQWETPTYIGDTANNIIDVFLNGDKLYIGKENGLFWLDTSGGVHPLLPELAVSHSTDNFKYIAEWQTSAYFSLQKGMGEMTTSKTFRPMGPLTEIDDIGKVGSIVGITSDRDWLYVAVDEGVNTNIYKGREVYKYNESTNSYGLYWQWCPWIFLGTDTCSVIKVCQHSTTDRRLWFGYGNATGYVTISDNPLADSNARFCASGWLRMSYTYGTDPIYDKLWQSAVLEVTRYNSGTESTASSGETVEVRYRDDDDIGSGTSIIGTATTCGVHETNFSSPLNNKRIQYELWLASDTNTATPVVSYFQAKGVEKPTTVRVHEAYYSIGDRPSKRSKISRTLLRAGRDSTTLIKFADLRYGQTTTGTAVGDYVWCIMQAGYPKEVEIKHEKQRQPELAIMVRLQEVSYTIS
jgi:hypothetical protein